MDTDTIDLIRGLLYGEKSRLELLQREWDWVGRRKELARIDAALVALEQAAAFEVVPDGRYCAESPDGSDDWCIKVTDDGDSIWQYSSSDDEWVEIGSLSFWGFKLTRPASARGQEDSDRG